MVISTSGCKSSSCHLQRKFLVNSVNKTLRWPGGPTAAAAWAGFLGACKRRGCQLLPNRRAVNISPTSIEKPELSAPNAFWLKKQVGRRWRTECCGSSNVFFYRRTLFWDSDTVQWGGEYGLSQILWSFIGNKLCGKTVKMLKRAVVKLWEVNSVKRSCCKQSRCWSGRSSPSLPSSVGGLW